MENLIKDSLPYITGMGYRKQCDFYYDEFEKSDYQLYYENCKVFVKTDLLTEFYLKILSKINVNIILVTHNSDINITDKFKEIVNSPKIIKWYGQNVNFKHNKLIPIPIGIANRRWKHGNVDVITNTLNKKIIKKDNIYCNFSINTNPRERKKCIENVNLRMENKVNFKDYIKNLSEYQFSICPEGNGLDTHKVWESLYVKTIPIVTKSITFEVFSKQYPIYMIDSWKVFNKKDFNGKLYIDLIKKYENFNLNISL